MAERLESSFRLLVAGGLAVCAAAMLAAVHLLARGSILAGAITGFITYFALRGFWRATRRKRELLMRGYCAGSRVGTHWVYEELHDGVIESIELPLDYVGRGEYDIHVPGEARWRATMPAWARERRAEIIERLGTVFKRSQMRFDPDNSARPSDA